MISSKWHWESKYWVYAGQAQGPSSGGLSNCCGSRRQLFSFFLSQLRFLDNMDKHPKRRWRRLGKASVTISDIQSHQRTFNSFPSLELSHCSQSYKHNFNIYATFNILFCFSSVYISNNLDSSTVNWLGDLNMALRPNYSLWSKTRINQLIFDVDLVAHLLPPNSEVTQLCLMTYQPLWVI